MYTLIGVYFRDNYTLKTEYHTFDSMLESLTLSFDNSYYSQPTFVITHGECFTSIKDLNSKTEHILLGLNYHQCGAVANHFNSWKATPGINSDDE